MRKISRMPIWTGRKRTGRPDFRGVRRGCGVADPFSIKAGQKAHKAGVLLLLCALASLVEQKFANLLWIRYAALPFLAQNRISPTRKVFVWDNVDHFVFGLNG